MFRGCLVPIVTPFLPSGALDETSLESLVDWLVTEGVDGIICCGTTGEGLSLSFEESERVVQICLSTVSRKVPVLAATGSSSTHACVQKTYRMKQLGVDGCLVVTPYYVKPSQEGLFLHYQEVAKVGVPFLIYENPGRTQVAFLPQTIARLADFPEVVGVKYSGRSLEWMDQVQSLCQLPIFCGEDELMMQMLKRGAVGSICVASHVVPRQWAQRMLVDGEKGVRDPFAELIQVLFLESNPQCLKYLLSLLGKCLPYLRLPLRIPDIGIQKKIEKAWVEYLDKESALR